MSRPPRLAQAILRALLPRHEISDALEGDLTDEFVMRAARSVTRARWWYRWQVATLPYVRLSREVERLRQRAGSRKIGSGGGGMGGLTMDLRIAVRALLRRPAFSGVAILTLALGIGAATLLFSVVEGVLLSPLPYEEPDELVSVYLTSDEWRDNELLRAAWDSHTLTLDHVEAFRSAPGPVDDIAGYGYRQLPLDPGDGAAELADLIMVDRALFSVLGAEPIMGRVPSEDELRSSAPVAVLRHETWTSRFGGDPEVVGRSFRFGTETFTVVGVMPPGFFFPTEESGDLWGPVLDYARSWPSFYAVARLSPDATVEEATVFFDRVARRLGEDDASKAGLGGRAVPHLESVVGEVAGGIRLLFGTALLVVLVACVNLANLFFVRATGRHQELAVRASLGGGTGSLVRVMLAETAVIGLVGGGLGVLLAGGSVGPFVDALGASLRGLPRQDAIGLDLGVLLFSLGATLVTMTLSGVVPALSAARRAPGRTLRDAGRSGAGRGTRRTQRLLLAAQATLTVVLVSAAALLARSFAEAAAVEMGMDVEQVAVLELEADLDGPEQRAALLDVQESLRRRVLAIPAVSAAGLAWSLPSRGGVLLFRVSGDDADPGQGPLTPSVAIGEGYFESMGIPLLAGRGLRDADRPEEGAKVVVSESLARRLYGRTDVVGRWLMRGDGPGAAPHRSEIVGVVADARQLSAFQEPEPTLYYSIRQSTPSHVYLTLAVDGDPASVLTTALDAVRQGDLSLEVTTATTLRRMLQDGMRHIRLRMVLMAALAAVAGILALIGIAGVVAHYLSEQQRDVGIRMALGAATGREVGRVVRHALVPTGLGVAAGVVAARLASRVMEGFVFAVDLADPFTYLAVGVLLLGVAALTAWIPARRATAIDPARVLNEQ